MDPVRFFKCCLCIAFAYGLNIFKDVNLRGQGFSGRGIHMRMPVSIENKREKKITNIKAKI